MCILIYKPKNVELPSEEYLIESWKNNPDGAGISWSDGIHTYLKKGFMSMNHLLLFVETKQQEFKSMDVLIHFRYATHGSVISHNCHPFVVSDRIKDLRRLKYKGSDLILAHNGIISGKDYTKKTINDLSDTMIFTKRLHTLGKKSNEIQNILKSGKFCLMYPDHVEMFGLFHEDNGVYYSNTSYKPIKWSYNKASYSYYDMDDQDIACEWCKHEEECLKSGICYYTDEEIENECVYGDPDFCPLACDYQSMTTKGKNDIWNELL